MRNIPCVNFFVIEVISTNDKCSVGRDDSARRGRRALRVVLSLLHYRYIYANAVSALPIFLIPHFKIFPIFILLFSAKTPYPRR